MKIDERIKQWQAEHPKRPFFSLEFFPPKTEMGVLNLYDRFDRFAVLNPLWIDMTWGAGGSTSESTLELCAHALKFHGLETLMHLTCTNMSEKLLEDTLVKCQKKGIKNLLALRGDPPRAGQVSEPSNMDGQGKFKYAADLVRYIREHYGNYFCIGVAGYPEGHLENPDPEDDLRRLKEKVDAGADLIISQLFFDVSQFESFLQRCRNIGITVPILPGVLPIQSYSGFKRFTSFCRTHVPPEVLGRLEAVKDDDQRVKDYGVELGIKMCKELLALGVPGLHFYTLNLEVSVLRIIDSLDILELHLPNRELPWRPRGGSRQRRIDQEGGTPTRAVGDESRPSSYGMNSASETDLGTPSSTGHPPDRAFADLGQREDLMLNFMNEDVRPVFWSNRPKSYIYRTAGWDDFPNGRWGPRDSPAYGEPFYSMCVSPDERSIQARREMWGASLDSVNDVVLVFVNYLKFQDPTKRLPWTSENLNEETTVIKKQLIKLNSLGICTINSQPRVNGALSSDPIFGWGPLGGIVYQKAYIEFFCSPAIWDQLYKYLADGNRRHLLSFMAVKRKGKVIANIQTFGGKSRVNALTWGVFPNSEIRQPTIVDIESFDAWKDEAFELWQLEWASLYADGSKSREIINDICHSWYLVNIVDNDLLAGDLFGQLIEIVSQK